MARLKERERAHPAQKCNGSSYGATWGREKERERDIWEEFIAPLWMSKRRSDRIERVGWSYEPY